MDSNKIADGIKAGSRIIGNAGALIQSGGQALKSIGNLYDSYVKDGEVISWKNATDLITLGLSVAGMGMAGKSLAKDGKALKAVSQGNVNVKPAAVSNSTASGDPKLQRITSKGNLDVVPGTSKLIGAEEGEKFGIYASKATPIEGYTDVIVHGAPPNKVAVMHNGKWVYLSQRSLANFLKQDAGYTEGAIRLLSCGTGSTPNGFAQNLANKMGVEVMAPSDTIWAFSNVKLTIGPKKYSNTGHWNIFTPGSH